MAIPAGQNYNHGHKARHDESDIDLNVREHNEPSIPMTLLELSCAFGAGNAAGWIFATVSLLATEWTELVVERTQCQCPTEIARL